jgi:hypothetical protein
VVTSTEPRLPNFIVIGAMKAGTSTLYRILRAHPDVYLPDRKELHYFSGPYTGPPREVVPDAGDTSQKGLEWYRSQFAAAGDRKAVGEATPKYTRWPAYQGAPERIARVLPDVRLVYLVREPVSRMQSHYLHYVSTGAEKRPVNVALREDPLYLDASRYATQIDKYMEHFDRRQLLVITSEDLRDHQQQTVARVLRFLDVDDTWVVPSGYTEAHRTADKRAANRGLTLLRRVPLRKRLPGSLRTAVRNAVSEPLTDRVEPLDAALRAELQEVFDDEGRRLEPYLGRVPAWVSSQGASPVRSATGRD